jgi:hypothetical protein
VQRPHRRDPYTQPARLRPDVQPADPVVLRLFEDLQLAEWTRNNNRKEMSTRKRRQRIATFEREAWDWLVHYLLTLERPDIRV